MKFIIAVLLWAVLMTLISVSDRVKHIDTVLSAPPQGEK